MASKLRRIFLIRWDVPSRLEEFLIPNQLNWTVPSYILPHLQDLSKTYQISKRGVPLIKTTSANEMVHRGGSARAAVWEARVQDLHGGSAVYHQLVTDPINAEYYTDEYIWNANHTGWDMYQAMYHDLFRALFVPSEPIAALVQRKMESAQLVPGMYAMAHYRAFYAIEDRKGKRANLTLRNYAIHAVQCASAINPGVPVYFASDSKFSVNAVREYANGADARKKNLTIVTFSTTETDQEPLHIGMVKDWEGIPPSEFYPTFVDLLLMANGRCLSYGQGGYGQYAALLSYDASCTIRHSTKSRKLPCPTNNEDVEMMAEHADPGDNARVNRRRRRRRRTSTRQT
jgi:hypothetical protein